MGFLGGVAKATITLGVAAALGAGAVVAYDFLVQDRKVLKCVGEFESSNSYPIFTERTLRTGVLYLRFHRLDRSLLPQPLAGASEPTDLKLCVDILAQSCVGTLVFSNAEMTYEIDQFGDRRLHLAKIDKSQPEDNFRSFGILRMPTGEFSFSAELYRVDQETASFSYSGSCEDHRLSIDEWTRGT